VTDLYSGVIEFTHSEFNSISESVVNIDEMRVHTDTYI